MDAGDASPEGTTAALLEAARQGDRAALETLLERHQGQVYRFGMRMCRDPEDAKDVLQETLLAMARGVADFRGASSLSTWLYTIARSFCIKKRRRRKFAPSQELSLDAAPGRPLEAIPDPAPPPDDQAARREVEAALDAAIASLAPAHREVLVLRDVEGLTAPEVAEVLGLSAQAVKSRLHRARLSLRESVAPALGIPPAPAAEGTCPDVLHLLSRHLEGEIAPQVCAEMERHLARCGRCRGACDGLRRTLALCKALPTPEVPDELARSVRSALRALLGRTRSSARSSRRRQGNTSPMRVRARGARQ